MSNLVFKAHTNYAIALGGIATEHVYEPNDSIFQFKGDLGVPHIAHAFLQRVSQMTFPREYQTLSEVCYKIIAASETLLATESIEALQVEFNEFCVTVSHCDFNYAHFYHKNRSRFDDEQRLIFWIARLRLFLLINEHAPYLLRMREIRRGHTSSENGKFTAELRAARHRALCMAFARNSHSATTDYCPDEHYTAACTLLWPEDLHDVINKWRVKYNLALPYSVASSRCNRAANSHETRLNELWHLILKLQREWHGLTYTAELIAYVHQLLHRVAAFSYFTYTSEISNFPSLLKPAKKRKYASDTDDDYGEETTEASNASDGSDPLLHPSKLHKLLKLTTVEVQEKITNEIDAVNNAMNATKNTMHATVNDLFIGETERIFHYFEACITRCSYAKWHSPYYPIGLGLNAPLVLKMPNGRAIARFDKFIADKLSLATHKVTIETRFRESVFDMLVFPGEEERFIQLYPNMSRGALACISKMRRDDYDVYLKMYGERSISVIFRELCEQNLRESSIYMLIVCITMDVHFRVSLESSSFSTYVLSLNNAHIEDLEKDSFVEVLRYNGDRDHSALATGTVHHILRAVHAVHEKNAYAWSTLNSSEVQEKRYTHPLLVRCVGTLCVVLADNETKQSTALQLQSGKTNAAIAVLNWLHLMCADMKICGLLSNNASLTPILRELRPFKDSLDVANRADAKVACIVQAEYERIGLCKNIDFFAAHEENVQQGEDFYL